MGVNLLFSNLFFPRLFRFGPCEKRRGAKNDRIAKRRAGEGGRERETEEETKLIPGEAKTKSRLEHFQTVQTDVRANMDVQR